MYVLSVLSFVSIAYCVCRTAQCNTLCCAASQCSWVYEECEGLQHNRLVGCDAGMCTLLQSRNAFQTWNESVLAACRFQAPIGVLELMHFFDSTHTSINAPASNASASKRVKTESETGLVEAYNAQVTTSGHARLDDVKLLPLHELLMLQHGFR